MNLYQEELMDHYRYPRYKGVLNRPDFETSMLNPSCGDAVSFQGIIINNTLTAVAFQGHGCVISQAAASLLAQKYLNSSLDVIEKCTVSDMLALVKIPLGPTRAKCALLALQALQQGIALYRAQQKA